jgi:hypothetical protein
MKAMMPKGFASFLLASAGRDEEGRPGLKEGLENVRRAGPALAPRAAAAA